MGPDGRRNGSFFLPRMLSLVVYTWTWQQQQFEQDKAGRLMHDEHPGVVRCSLLPGMLSLAVHTRQQQQQQKKIYN
jgi:hypothetical protein